ncbi:unnamed protein product [Symbiodinium sp. CCMP2592]|nr:unnamed protein product [Symbiodinium sp. CCMP2592]
MAGWLRLAEQQISSSPPDSVEPKPKRKPGRPRGTFGGSELRASLKAESSEAVQQAMDRQRFTSDSSQHPAVQATTVMSTGQQGVVATGARASPVQEMILQHAVAQAKRCRQEGAPNPATTLLFEGRRNIVSQSVASNMLDVTREDARRVAAIVVEGGARLWHGFLDHISALVKGPHWKGVLFGVRRRYDETPLPLRVQEPTPQPSRITTVTTGNAAAVLDAAKDSAKGTTGRKKRVTKIMQSELNIFALLERQEQEVEPESRSKPGKFLHICGKFPCWLQCMQSTTAQQISQSQRNLLSSISNLNDVSKLFMTRHACVTTDRYAANLVAEQDIQSRSGQWCLTHMLCHVHQLSSSEKSLGDLIAGHVGGIVSLGLSTRFAGVLPELQQALYSLFEDELEIIVGQGPAREHQDAILDLFLPVDEKKVTEVADRMKSRGPTTALAQQRRRCVIRHYLNGAIDQEKLVHFTPVLLDREQLLAEIRTELIPALLPMPCPIINRSRWFGCEQAFGWVGILLSHHNLLPRLIQRWRGISTAAASGMAQMARPASVSTGPSLGPKFGNWGDLANRAAQTQTAQDTTAGVHPERFPARQGQNPAEDMGYAEGTSLEPGDSSFVAEILRDPATGDINWQEQNKATVAKAVAWCQSQPANAVIAMSIAWGPILCLMHTVLKLGSESWEHEQDSWASTKLQSARVVSRSSHGHLKHMNDLMHTSSAAIQASGRTLSVRCLLFRLLSRCGATVHQVFALQHKRAPYVLFGALNGNLGPLRGLPECLHDELTTVVCGRFPKEGTDLLEPEAQAILACLAQNLESDIVGIETRHASVRRCCYARSVQVCTIDFRDLGAEWITRQQVILREPLTTAATKQRKPREKAKAKKSRGGSWRAYQHLFLRNEPMDPARASQEYHALKQRGGPDWDQCKNVGLLMTMAGRAGKKSFKRWIPSRGRRVVESSGGLRCLKDALVEISAGRKRSVELAAAAEEQTEQLLDKVSKDTADQLGQEFTEPQLSQDALLGSVSNGNQTLFPANAGASNGAFQCLPASMSSPSLLKFLVPADVLAQEPYLSSCSGGLQADRTRSQRIRTWLVHSFEGHVGRETLLAAAPRATDRHDREFHDFPVLFLGVLLLLWHWPTKPFLPLQTFGLASPVSVQFRQRAKKHQQHATKKEHTKARKAMMKGFLILRLEVGSEPGHERIEKYFLPVADEPHEATMPVLSGLPEQMHSWAMCASSDTGSGESMASAHQPVFSHIGYVNYRSMHFSVLPLQAVSQTDDSASDSASQFLSVLSPVAFYRCFEYFQKELDFRLPYVASFYIMCSDDETELLPSEMIPGRMEAVPYSEIPTLQVWKGQHAEERDRARIRSEKEKKRKPPSGSHPGGIRKFARKTKDPISEAAVDADPAPGPASGDAGQDDENVYVGMDDGLSNGSSDADENRSEQDLIEALEQELEEQPENPPEAGIWGRARKDLFSRPAEGAASSSSAPNAEPAMASAAAGPDAAGESGSRRTGPREVAPDKIVIPDFGEMHFYEKSQTIQCFCRVHAAADCRKSRTVKGSETLSRVGQGRPIGLLAAWLYDHENHDCVSEPKRSRNFVHPFKERLAAREKFDRLPGASAFALHERAQAPDETSPEPLTIP